MNNFQPHEVGVPSDAPEIDNVKTDSYLQPLYKPKRYVATMRIERQVYANSYAELAGRIPEIKEGLLVDIKVVTAEDCW